MKNLTSNKREITKEEELSIEKTIYVPKMIVKNHIRPIQLAGIMKDSSMASSREKNNLNDQTYDVY